MDQLTRRSRRFRITLPSGQKESQPIKMGEMAMGILVFPSSWPGDDIAIMIMSAPDEEFLPLYDSDGNQLIVTGDAGTAVAMPDSVAAADTIMLVNVVAGVPTAPSDTAIFEVVLKS